VDSGKSTLSGRLLHLLGRISHKEMHKYEKEAKQQVIIPILLCKTQSNVYEFVDKSVVYSIREKGRLLMPGHWMRVLKKEKGE